MADLTPLHRWFTPTEAHRYFGARTQAEVDEAVQFIGGLKPDHRERFKVTLRNLAIERATEKTYGTR